MSLARAITSEHASANTKLHALYAYHCLGLTAAEVAQLYNKSPSTIKSWIDTHANGGPLHRHQTASARKFTPAMRHWLFEYYLRKPLSYLSEAKSAFEAHWQQHMSTASVWRIIREHGLHWKTLERRAMQIKLKDFERFVNEINSLDWKPSNLLFLDEVSFDNRDAWRQKGYGRKGQRLCVRTQSGRLPRVSLLCMMAINGLEEVYMVPGTFIRHSFTQFCIDYAGGGRVAPSSNACGAFTVIMT
ncbi:hypothetical protein RI367_004492 [Sorochytrium milnesiophthora]